MEPTKQQALDLISQLPDDCSWEEIIEALRAKENNASSSREAEFEESLPPVNEFIEKLEQVLQKEISPLDEVNLYPAPDGKKVKGYLISETFAGMEDADRQDHLWDIFEANFDSTEQRRILSILAYTPEEYRAFREEE